MKNPGYFLRGYGQAMMPPTAVEQEGLRAALQLGPDLLDADPRHSALELVLHDLSTAVNVLSTEFWLHTAGK